MCERCKGMHAILCAMSCIYNPGRTKHICKECLALYPGDYCCCCINPPQEDEVKKD